MKQLTAETERQKKELEETRRDEENRQLHRQQKSALVIQKTYRGYRYGDIVLGEATFKGILSFHLNQVYHKAFGREKDGADYQLLGSGGVLIALGLSVCLSVFQKNLRYAFRPF